MSQYERIYLRCDRGQTFQIMCVGIPIDDPDEGYIPVTCDEDAVECNFVVWGVYQQLCDGGFLNIADHPTREQALSATQHLINIFNHHMAQDNEATK